MTTPHRLTGEQYIQLLLRRQNAWLTAHPPAPGTKTWVRPLLSWFIRKGDEDLVDLPACAPNHPD